MSSGEHDSGEYDFNVGSTFSGYLLTRFQHHISSTETASLGSYNTVSATELDSHADSPVVGKFCQVLEDTGRKARVSGFTSELGKPLVVKVVNAAIAYDCEHTGKTYILVVCNALYFENMEVNLIPPFVMRLAGVEVDECPKFLSKNPTEENHSIYFPEEDIRMHLQLEGIISYLPSRRPSHEEIKEAEGHYLLLSPNLPEWDPHNDIYKDQEYGMTDYNGNLKPRDHTRSLLCQVEMKSSSSEVPTNHIMCSALNQSSLDIVSDPYSFAAAVNEPYEVAVGISSVQSKHRKGQVKIHELAERLNISLEMAKKTIQSTTQLGVRTVTEPTLTRKYQTNDRMLRYSRLAVDTFMDTMFASKKVGPSIRGYTSCQVFATEFGHVFVVPLESKAGVKIAQAIKRYFKEVGVPLHLICDQAREQIKGDARILCNEAGCHVIELEKGTPASNRAERNIKILKDGTKQDLFNSNCPMVLWCYCIERRAQIVNVTTRVNTLLQGQTPHSKLTGQPTDISHLCEYGWYEWVIYRIEGAPFPTNHQRLGRVLGPSTNAGSVMSQWILTSKGQVMPIQTLRRLTKAEYDRPSMKQRMKEFDEAIKDKLGDSMTPPPTPQTVDDVYPDHDDALLDEDDVVYPEHEDVYEGLYGEPSSTVGEIDDLVDPDLYFDAEVMLPKDGAHMQAARVIGQSRDKDGNTFGEFNQNPILNTKVYDVLFPDGSIQQYSANTIAENIYSQVDEDGHRYQLMEHILDHRSDGRAVRKEDAFTVSRNGSKSRRQTTRGWYLQVQWKDGTDSWVSLRELKESHPIQVAEYADKAEIADEPAFAWWVPYVLKKRDKIIAKVVSRQKKKTHKYGIEVPRNVRHALQLDKENGNDHWKEAIKREMDEVRVAFDIKDSNFKNVEPGREFLDCYMIFDVKMDFTRKARFVANGAKTKDLTSSTYAGVVSRETVRIALTYAALNGLDVMAADIKNAYLTAPITEKYWTKCGPEFGPELEGNVAYITRALYGTKCGGRDFRNHLRECMDLLGYEPCLADPDLWMRIGVKENGTEYYDYMLLYVDDTLAIGTRPMDMLKEVDHYFPMKNNSMGPPKIYLGAKIGKVKLPNGVEAFSMSMSQYVREAVKGVEAYLKKKDLALLKKAATPMTMNYSPELDQSEELDHESAAYYQSLIGILRWIVEMGRMDICMEVSAMSSYVAMPREGHMQQLLHIFAYLKIHHNARVVFDPTYPDIDDESFERKDWSSMYGDTSEPIPENMPKPLGKEFLMRAYVDASFAGCKMTRRSRTGFIVYLNSAPIYYLSKKQGSCETSTFGSEFIAMKQCCEYVRGLRYKLRMMGVPVNNSAFIYGDNQSVLWNTTVPDSILKKKSSAVAYHFVREGVARQEWLTTYVNTKENPSDVMTKMITSMADRKRKVRMMLYDIYPEL